MSGKLKIIIVMVGLAALSFGAFFFVFSSMNKNANTLSTAKETAAGSESATSQPSVLLGGAVPAMAAKEKQLDDLIRELRLKIDACRKREADLEQRERHVQIAEEMLRKHAEEQDNLKVQLAAPLASLKEAQAELNRSLTLVSAAELVNIKKLAATYEKMDASAGGKIVESMCTGKQFDDAVKILHYMSDRSAAKLLAEISDKSLVGRLIEKMKRVKEET